MKKSTGTNLTATYRIVTPMFCAGADQSAAELRLPSFKGALRFWWRSLMWGMIRDHRELCQQEANLFGASDAKVGQSKVRMRIRDRNLDEAVQPQKVFENGRLAGAHYLGYGVMEAFDSWKKGTKAGELTRAMIPGGSFTVELRCSRFVSPEQFKQLQQACVLLGTLGGMGSKSRKGFGSLTLTDLCVEGVPASDLLDPEQRLRSVLTTLSAEFPSWTAWSRDSRVIKATSHDTSRAVQLLDLIGREMVHFRSWGQQGKVLGVDSERNFELDHGLSKGSTAAPGYPFRTAFGLPHNYGQGKQNAVEPVSQDRRASPLLIHLDQSSAESPPEAFLVFLPSQFLPDDQRISAFNREVKLRVNEEFWFPIHAFLDRLRCESGIPEARPGYDHFPDGSQWWQKRTSINAQEVKLV